MINTVDFVKENVIINVYSHVMQGNDEEDQASDVPSPFEQLRNAIAKLRFSFEDSQLDPSIASETSLANWHTHLQSATSPQVNIFSII